MMSILVSVSFQMAELFGVSVGILLMGYGAVLTWYHAFETVDNWFAWAFSTAGFVLILGATDIVVPAYSITIPLRFSAYVLAFLIGTAAFIEIMRAPDRFRRPT